MQNKIKHHKKIKKSQKKYHILGICAIICAVLLLIGSGMLLYRMVQPFYKVSSRVKEVTEENKKRSEKVLGWIRVQGTNIDYPILYSKDENTNINDFVDYDFTWTNVDSKELTNRPIILGHNIKNVSSHPIIGDKNHTRFEQLAAFIYSDFVKDNKYIQYTIGGKDYLYKIFSISFVRTHSSDYGLNSFTKDEMKEYIEQSKKDSYFDFDVEVDSNDGIITLVTCTRFFGAGWGYDFKIDARLVRQGERIENYSFKEKESYKEIKKILKGDEANEKA